MRAGFQTHTTALVDPLGGQQQIAKHHLAGVAKRATQAFNERELDDRRIGWHGTGLGRLRSAKHEKRQGQYK